MTKSELIEAVAKQSGGALTKKAAGALVETVFDTVGSAVKKNGKFAYPGFGTFTVRARKARIGRNPQTGETIKIKASKLVAFRAAPMLKKLLK